MSGEFETEALGADYAGVSIEDVGGGISWLSFWTSECITYGTESARQWVWDFQWTPTPDSLLTDMQTWEDDDGDWKLVAYWGDIMDPPGTVVKDTYGISTDFHVGLFDSLDGFVSQTAFPIPSGEIPSAIADAYLQAGPFTESDSPEIFSLADSLTATSESELSAVQRVVDWCVDNLQAVADPPNDQSALQVLHDPEHLADCRGHSHLAIALLRSIGIPARFVGGMRMPGAYYIPTEGGGSEPFNDDIELGRHAWVEVYYPESGWICYDVSWHLYHHIDTRNYRLCTGLDAQEAMRDIHKYFYSAPDPPPTFEYVNRSTSYVMYDINALAYMDTLATPQQFSLGDASYDTGVDSEHEMIPAGFSVARSTPNPFTSSTRIRLHIPADGTSVNVNIYNVSGRLIRVLVEEELDSGDHSITWDGRDSRNRSAASGVYFCEVRAAGCNESQKIVLIR